MALKTLTMTRGEQFQIADTILKDGVAYPPTWVNYVVRFVAKRKRSDAAALISKDSGGNGITTGIAGTGAYTIQILATDTAALTAAELLEYEVWLDEPGGTSDLVAYGFLRVDLSIR